MTEIEAIEAIENDLKWHSKELKSKYKEVLKFAINALEKQIPKQPLRIPTDDSCLYYELRCPCCDAYMSGIIEMHHCKCGQALDWT